MRVGTASLGAGEAVSGAALVGPAAEALRPLYLVQAPYRPALATLPNGRFTVVIESMPGSTHKEPVKLLRRRHNG